MVERSNLSGSLHRKTIVKNAQKARKSQMIEKRKWKEQKGVVQHNTNVEEVKHSERHTVAEE